MDAFHVVTEFRFDVAQAVINSEKLQGAVEGISGAADKALLSMKSLSVGLLGSFGLGSMGLVGFLSTAITYADKFNQYQIKIANQFQNGGMFKGAENFGAAMQASEAALLNMQKVATTFSLPASDLVNTATLIGATLTPRGLDNASLTKSTDLARMFMKVSPMLGADPSLSQGELLGLLNGRADMGGRFTQRIFSDSKALHQYAGNGGTQAFNRLEEHKRVALVAQAMGELGNNMKAAHAMAMTFSGQLQLMKDQLFGVFSVFRSIGNAVKDPLVKMMAELNKWMGTQGRSLVDKFASVLAPILSDPKRLLLGVMQARQVKNDVHSAGHAMHVGGVLLGIGHALEFLGVTAAFATPVTFAVGVAMSVFAQTIERVFPLLGPMIDFLMKWTLIIGGIATAVLGVIGYFWGMAGVMTALSLIGTALVATISTLFYVFLPLVVFFQLLSRAAAIAQLADAQFLVGALDAIADSFIYFKNIIGLLLSPLVSAFEAIAQWISPIFRFSMLISAAKWGLDFLTGALTAFLMGVQGVAFGIMQIISNIGKVLTGQLKVGDAFSGVSDAYDAGMQDIYDKVYGAIAKGDVKGVQQNTTNIGQVNINNQFKEQMEPDRIAFALKDQLLRAAANKGQASGNSMAARAAR